MTPQDTWWPDGLPEWITKHAEAGDETYAEAGDETYQALDKGLRSFGWPDYNVPFPLPLENTWPAIALSLAQRHREAVADTAEPVAAEAGRPILEPDRDDSDTVTHG